MSLGGGGGGFFLHAQVRLDYFVYEGHCNFSSNFPTPPPVLNDRSLIWVQVSDISQSDRVETRK